MARYCDGPHIAHAKWRTKTGLSSTGNTTQAWCNECKDRMMMEVADRWSAGDFEAIGQPTKVEEK